MSVAARWILCTAVAFSTALLVAAGAYAAPATLGRACRAAIDARFASWRTPAVTADVAAWAREERFNPVVADGDFDADGRRDQAVLVQSEGAIRVAVCFAGRDRMTVEVIDRPYCIDYVATSPAHSEHYNYETDSTERIARDGISVGCFEKAGATYVREGEAFRRIVDSD